MKLIFALMIAVVLYGCATTATSVHEDAGKALVAAETIVDAASVAADAAIRSGLTSKAQDAQIAVLTAEVQQDVAIARRAYAASDAATMGQMATQLLNLAGQLNGTHP